VYLPRLGGPCRSEPPRAFLLDLGLAFRVGFVCVLEVILGWFRRTTIGSVGCSTIDRSSLSVLPGILLRRRR
jgi:hypothetical protein